MSITLQPWKLKLLSIPQAYPNSIQSCTHAIVKNIFFPDRNRNTLFSCTQNALELSIVADVQVIATCFVPLQLEGMTVTDDVFRAFLVEDIEGIDNSGRRINELSALLSRNGVSIFYLSTYQADFILCKEKRLELVLPTIRSIFALYFDSDCESSIAAAHGRHGSISGQSDIMGSFPGSSFTSVNSFLHTPSSPARYAPHFQHQADRNARGTHPFSQIHNMPQPTAASSSSQLPSTPSQYTYPTWSSGSGTSSGTGMMATGTGTGYLGSSLSSSYTRPSASISIPFGRRESLAWGLSSAHQHHNPHMGRVRRQHSESESSAGDVLSQAGFSMQSNASQFMFSYRSNQGRQNSITSSFGDTGIGRYYPKKQPHGSSIDSLESTAAFAPSAAGGRRGSRRGVGGGFVDRSMESGGSSSGDLSTHHQQGRHSPMTDKGSTTLARNTSDNSLNMFPLTDIREETSASSSVTNTAENSSLFTQATRATAPTTISTSSAVLSSEEESITRSPYPWSATGSSMPPFSFLSASSFGLMNETQEELEEREANIKAKVRQSCPRSVIDEKLVIAGLSLDYEDQWAVPLLKVLFYPETLSGLTHHNSRFVSLTVTDEGMSLIADESIQNYFEEHTLNMSLSESKTLRCIQVDLSMFGLDTYGLVYSMSNLLVDVNINMLCLSTYRTANILVNDADLLKSIEVLGLEETATTTTTSVKARPAETGGAAFITIPTVGPSNLPAMSSVSSASPFDKDDKDGEEDLESQDEEDETSSYASSTNDNSPPRSIPSPTESTPSSEVPPPVL